MRQNRSHADCKHTRTNTSLLLSSVRSDPAQATCYCWWMLSSLLLVQMMEGCGFLVSGDSICSRMFNLSFEAFVWLTVRLFHLNPICVSWCEHQRIIDVMLGFWSTLANQNTSVVTAGGLGFKCDLIWTGEVVMSTFRFKASHSLKASVSIWLAQ